MRTLARAAAGSFALLCAALALVAAAVAAIGIAGTRSAASQGNVIADGSHGLPYPQSAAGPSRPA
jgi:hypothetical protein